MSTVVTDQQTDRHTDQKTDHAAAVTVGRGLCCAEQCGLIIEDCTRNFAQSFEIFDSIVENKTTTTHNHHFMAIIHVNLH